MSDAHSVGRKSRSFFGRCRRRSLQVKLPDAPLVFAGAFGGPFGIFIFTPLRNALTLASQNSIATAGELYLDVFAGGFASGWTGGMACVLPSSPQFIVMGPLFHLLKAQMAFNADQELAGSKDQVELWNPFVPIGPGSSVHMLRNFVALSGLRVFSRPCQDVLAKAANFLGLQLPQGPQEFFGDFIASMGAAILSAPLNQLYNFSALTTNKWQSRAVVASHGVSVPKAQLLRPGDKVEMRVPLIIKPCEDNSMGITLVQTESDIESALIEGFKYDDQLLCEQFIPLGRELRIGLVDGEDDELEFLPVIEYFLGHKKQPIRTSADKISSPDGTANGMDFVGGDRQCPADIDEVLRRKLVDMARRSHEALGCRHYSLYDVRVDPEGNPFFIEASPYCSFSPKSVIVTMSRGDPKYNDTDIFYRLARKAIREHQPIGSSNQAMGMRSRGVLKVVRA